MPKREGSPAPDAQENQQDNETKTERTGQNQPEKSGRLNVPATEKETRYYQEANESRAKAKAYEAQLEGSIAEREAQAKYVAKMREMYPNWDRYNGVPLSEQNLTPEERNHFEQQAEKATQNFEQIYSGSVKELGTEVDKAVEAGVINPQRAEQMKAVLQNQEVKQNFFSKAWEWSKDKTMGVKEWIQDSPRLTNFLTGAAVGSVVQKSAKLGFIAAFGANLPVAIAAGGVGGGLLGAGRSIWRESKSYNAQAILDKFNNADLMEKAAMLSKLEDVHKNSRFEASPAEYQQIATTLAHAREQIQLELDKKEGRFAGGSDREKLSYILNLASGRRESIDKQRGREARKYIREIEKSLNSKDFSKRDFKNVFKNKKAVVARAALKGAAYGALGGAVGGFLSSYLDSSTETTHELINAKKELASEYQVQMDHRGFTGGARDALHELINEERGADPNFAQGVTVEQLVYAEDTLVKDALHEGVNPNVAEHVFTRDELIDALEKSGAVGDHSTLTEAGHNNISELIKTKAHFLSEATKEKMLDFSPAQAEQIIREVTVEKAVTLSNEDYYAIMMALGAVALSEGLRDGGRQQQARAKFEELRNARPEVGDAVAADMAGEDGEKPFNDQPIFRSSKGKDVGNKKDERFPEGPPPSPYTHPEGVKDNVEDQPIAKPEGSLGDADKQELNIAELTPEQLNAKLQAAGVKAEVKPWPEDQATPKHKEKMLQLVDEFIAYSPNLEGLAIPGQIVIGFQPKGRTKAEFVDGQIVLDVPLNQRGKAAGYFDGLDQKVKGLLAEHIPTEDEVAEAGEAGKAGEPDETEKATGVLSKAELKQRLLDNGLSASLVTHWRNRPTKEQRQAMSDSINSFIDIAKPILGTELRNRVVIDVRDGQSRPDVFVDDGEIILGLPIGRQYNEADYQGLAFDILSKDTDMMIKLLETRFGFTMSPDEQDRWKKLGAKQRHQSVAMLLAAKDKAAAVANFEKAMSSFEKARQEDASITPESRQLGPVPKSELFENPQISTDPNYEKIPEQDRYASERILDQLIANDLTDGLRGDVKIILSNEFKPAPGELKINMSKPDRKYLAGQLHAGLRRSAPDRLSRMPSQVQKRVERNLRYQQARNEEFDKNTPDAKIAEEFANKAISNLFDTEVNLVDFYRDGKYWAEWMKDEQGKLDKISPKPVSNSQRKKIESYMGQKKITIENLVKTDQLPTVQGVKPDVLKRFIAETAFKKLQDMIDDPNDRSNEFNDLRNRTEEYLERLTNA